MANYETTAKSTFILRIGFIKNRVQRLLVCLKVGLMVNYALHKLNEQVVMVKVDMLKAVTVILVKVKDIC